MASTNLVALKREAIEKYGLDKSKSRTMDREELEAWIEKARNGSKSKAKGKTIVKKAVAKKSVKKSKPTEKVEKKRPTISKSKVERTKTPAAKSTKGKAKRSSSASDAGRELVGSVDFSVTDGWNPREGSPVDVIFRALKKARGNVDKAFDALKPDIRDFISTHNKATGEKRTKAQMEAGLRYRINRVRWQFAVQTGQHAASENRVEYGTGDYASAKKSKAKSKATPAKAAKKPARSSAKKKTTRRK